MTLESNIELKPFTTFQIGGPAYYFCRIKFIQDLQEAAAFLKKSKQRFFLLGGGSNILVSDKGFNGLAMKMEIRGIKTRDIDDHTVELIAGAGENWDTVVAFAVSKGLYGLENLSAIPGSVGAAPVQNIGAYGTEIKDVISFVEVFDMKEEKLFTMSVEQCHFQYRDSIFKLPEKKDWVIVKVGFLLQRNGRVNIGYKDLKERFKDRYSKDVSLKEVRDAVIDIRSKKLPDVAKVGTAGSFFKNPFVSKEHYETLHEKWPGMPGFMEMVEGKEMVKLPLAWILDHICDLKGWKHSFGRVGSYENQPIVLVNYGGGTSDEVESAARHVIDEVKKKTDITVEWEVQAVGL